MKCANENCECRFTGKAVYILGGWWCADCARDYMFDELKEKERNNPDECLEMLARGLDYPVGEIE